MRAQLKHSHADWLFGGAMFLACAVLEDPVFTAVPEPSSLVLFALGAAALAGRVLARQPAADAGRVA